ncbi:hypothetical protein [Rhodanobacter sp. 115]|uniref:hypothetical protein n=1 Tax=Rhodanobacter sp. FW021-MT20 TaxID=1162282 RepID=UPI000260FC99|nr:hypothetical protein [Rhodanobacter sp. 115]EIL95866.1 hypothetical protein UU5_09217 [Rhodanobacter sp. 115]
MLEPARSSRVLPPPESTTASAWTPPTDDCPPIRLPLLSIDVWPLATMAAAPVLASWPLPPWMVPPARLTMTVAPVLSSGAAMSCTRMAVPAMMPPVPAMVPLLSMLAPLVAAIAVPPLVLMSLRPPSSPRMAAPDWLTMLTLPLASMPVPPRLPLPTTPP